MTDEKVIQAAIRELSVLFSDTRDPAEIESFLYSILTKTEIHAIGTRWTLVKEIAEGTTQREIARKYSLSLCKITRGSRELKKPDSPFRKMLDRLEKLPAANLPASE